MSFIAGPYYWQLNNNIIGVVEDAPRFRRVPTYEEITGDDFGDAVQAVVYRAGNMFLDMVFLEWDRDAVQQAIEPTATQLSSGEPLFGQIGESAIEPGYVLDASRTHAVGTVFPGPGQQPNLEGTAMAGQAPASVRAIARIAPGQSSDVLFGSRNRNVPVSFQLFPFLEEDSTSADNYSAFFVRFTPGIPSP